MKKFKVFILILMMILNPIASYGDFGLFGRDQCNYQQTPFPTNRTDAVSAEQQRLRGLMEYRATLSAKMSKIGDDVLKAQGVIKAYFPSPWCDAMFAHMDNGYDCCQPSSTVSQIINGNRMPAGQNTPDAYVDETVYTNPDETTETPAEQPTYTEPEAGQHCLQTGFAAGRDWNQYACRDGGQIDPQVCSNASISKSPADYQKCIGILNVYRDLAAQKKALATQIADLDTQINSTRATAETTQPQKRGFLSGLGNFLGGVMSVAMPFVLSQYLSYSANKQMAATPQPLPGPRHILAPPNATGRPMYGAPQQRTGTFGLSQMQPPPTYYGPQYGYGLSNGSMYGQTLPGLMTGGFGCSSGMLGGGMNMLSMMMMMSLMNGSNGSMNPAMMAMLGGGLNMNLNASLNSNFGLLGGGSPMTAMQMAYGNNMALNNNMLGTYTPPYQPGGIYGTTPTYTPNFQSSNISNFYTNQQNPNLVTGLNGCSACVSPIPGSQSYLNSGANSFFYAQQMNNNQRLMDNQTMLLHRQAELDYQLYQLRMMNSQNSMANGTNYQMGNLNGLNTPTYYNPSLTGI